MMKVQFPTLTGRTVETVVHAAAKPLPQEALDVLDTIKLWAGIVAGAMAIVALIIVGIGIMFAHKHGNGAEVFKGLAYWIAGVTIIALAGVLTAIFLPGS